VRVRAAERVSPQHLVGPQIAAVGELALDLRDAVDPRDRDPHALARPLADPLAHSSSSRIRIRSERAGRPRGSSRTPCSGTGCPTAPRGPWPPVARDVFEEVGDRDDEPRRAEPALDGARSRRTPPAPDATPRRPPAPRPCAPRARAPARRGRGTRTRARRRATPSTSRTRPARTRSSSPGARGARAAGRAGSSPARRRPPATRRSRWSGPASAGRPIRERPSERPPRHHVDACRRYALVPRTSSMGVAASRRARRSARRGPCRAAHAASSHTPASSHACAAKVSAALRAHHRRRDRAERDPHRARGLVQPAGKGSRPRSPSRSESRSSRKEPGPVGTFHRAPRISSPGSRAVCFTPVRNSRHGTERVEPPRARARPRRPTPRARAARPRRANPVPSSRPRSRDCGSAATPRSGRLDERGVVGQLAHDPRVGHAGARKS
jgi:hypothetical protein